MKSEKNNIPYIILPHGSLTTASQQKKHLKKLLRNDTILVSITAVDSEIGLKQPIEEISEILKEYPDFHQDIRRFQIGATIAVHTGPYPLGMTILKKEF